MYYTFNNLFSLKRMFNSLIFEPVLNNCGTYFICTYLLNYLSAVGMY